MLFTKEFENALHDNVDGPHGYVIAKDKKTGKVLVNKHNMIVQTGKEYLWSLFLHNNEVSAEEYEDSYRSYKLNKALFSSNTEEVSYTDLYSTVGIEFTLSYTNEAGSTTVPASFSEYNHHRMFSFTFSINGTMVSDTTPQTGINKDGLDSISSLELHLTNSTNRLLFSRIRFDTIPLSADSDIEITYYIYF